MVSYLSLDPRETNEKAYQIIYFAPEVPFKGTARLLGVPLDFQLTFSQDTDELKRSALDVLRYSDVSRIEFLARTRRHSVRSTASIHSPAQWTAHHPG